jgi:kumamolisin
LNAKHVILPGSKRAKHRLAERIGPVDPKERLEVTINLGKMPDAPEVAAKTLSLEELETLYGAKKEDADKVAASLARFGLKVEGISLLTRSMRVSGTAAQIEAAFQPKMAMYRIPGQLDRRLREGGLMIPADLEGLVTGVFGIDERRMAKPRISRPAEPRVPKKAIAIASTALSPQDLAKRYNFPPGDGAGQRIAIAEFGGGYFAEDAELYSRTFGLPPADVETVSVNGPILTLDEILALPSMEQDEELTTAGEVMLDVEIVAGLCPKAKISVYFSTFDQKGWVDLLDRVVSVQPIVLSVSYGLAEEDPGWSHNAIQAINDRLNAARLVGITACVSSGDDGSGDQLNDGAAHIDFPSSSPHVLSVGGTMVEPSTGNEVVWFVAPGRRSGGNGAGATGGGVSNLFNRPEWQKVNVASVNANSIDGRVMPDISALAGSPLYAFAFLGRVSKNGGTSASAPLLAALYTRINSLLPTAKQQRFLTPLLYQKDASGQPLGQGACRDITSGDNASSPSPGVGYKAKAGYDAATGWGVPDGINLLAALKQI